MPFTPSARLESTETDASGRADGEIAVSFTPSARLESTETAATQVAALPDPGPFTPSARLESTETSTGGPAIVLPAAFHPLGSPGEH